MTESLVVAGATLGVLRTCEELTDWSAAEDSQTVWLAHLVLAAPSITAAARHRGQLTLVGQRIPHMRGLTLAEWSVVPHHTLLRVSTTHHTTGVNTTLLTTDVDAAHSAWWTISLTGASLFSAASSAQIQRIASESILTDASAVMIVSDAARVGTTLNIATRVNTPVLTLH